MDWQIFTYTIPRVVNSSVLAGGLLYKGYDYYVWLTSTHYIHFEIVAWPITTTSDFKGAKL